MSELPAAPRWRLRLAWARRALSARASRPHIYISLIRITLSRRDVLLPMYLSSR